MVREPRAWLSVGGGKINLTHCEVTISRDLMASTFIAKMALDDKSNPGGAFWSSTSPIPASIIATNGDGTGEKTLIEGQIDIVEIEWAKREVTVEGTDQMSRLSDTRSDQSFPNMSKSDVLRQILAKHGFNLHIDDVADKAGKSWDNQDWAHITDNENELDVIHQVVESMGKTAFMVGRDFYVTNHGNSVGSTYPIVYKPPGDGDPPQLNGMVLMTKRNVQLAQISAKVASYPSYDKQPAEGTAGNGGDTGATPGPSSQGFDEAGFE